MKNIISAFVLSLCLLSAPSFAEEAPDHQERLELSQKMHEIQPASRQIEVAVNRVALRLPETERAKFKDSIMTAIDTQRLEELSIKTMADIFTKDELDAMVGYFAAPEAASISEKMPLYQDVIQPEITKMLDAAIMKARTGVATP